GPVTSTRYAWNVPAGTTTVSAGPTLNVRTFVATSLGVNTARRSVWPGARTSDDPTSGATFSSTIPAGTAVSTGNCCTLPSGWGTRLLPVTRPPAYTRWASTFVPWRIMTWSSRRAAASAAENTTVVRCSNSPFPIAACSEYTTESPARVMSATANPSAFPWTTTCELSVRDSSWRGSSVTFAAGGLRSSGVSALPSTSVTRTGPIALSRSYSLAPSPTTTIVSALRRNSRAAAAR